MFLEARQRRWSFDPAQDIGNARQDPDLFLDNHPPPIILDEIQFAPELVAALKRRVDKDRRPGQYLLTGSQQWHVLRSLAESLTGRAVFLDLEGFSLGEMAQANPSAASCGSPRPSPVRKSITACSGANWG